jgi:hypothetical protein
VGPASHFTPPSLDARNGPSSFVNLVLCRAILSAKLAKVAYEISVRSSASVDVYRGRLSLERIGLLPASPFSLGAPDTLGPTNLR